MKHILVTGATGGLGQNAVRILLQQGYTVTALGRNAAIGAQLSQQGASFIKNDLAHSAVDTLATLLHGVDSVWHCAARSAPWGSYTDFYKDNVLATRTVMHAAGKMGVPKVVHVSTPAIYFNYHNQYEVTEDFRPVCYVNHYAATKALAENEVRQAALIYPDTNMVILRPRAIFGPYDQVLLPRISKLLTSKNGKLPLPKAGRVRLDFTYVENVVHALLCASHAQNVVSGDAFNVTNQEPWLLADVLYAFFVENLDRPLRIANVPYPLLAVAARGLEWYSMMSHKEPLLTPYSVGAIAYEMTLSAAAAKATLGYRPIVSMKDAIATTAKWWKTT